MLDVAIVEGEVVDGTRRPRRRADVGIRDGRVVAVGKRDEPAARRLDASGRIIDAVIVDGAVVVDRGEFTGAVAGTVLRSGRDTETVPTR